MSYPETTTTFRMSLCVSYALLLINVFTDFNSISGQIITDFELKLKKSCLNKMPENSMEFYLCRNHIKIRFGVP